MNLGLEEKEMKIIWQGDDNVYDVVSQTDKCWTINKDGSFYHINKSHCTVVDDNEFEIAEQAFQRYFGSQRQENHQHTSGVASEVTGPVKSDGGSSSYYKLELPVQLVEKIVRDGAVETEDLIEVAFGNDFDYGNIFKSLVRAYKTEQGFGKIGNDVKYEMTKVQYSASKIKELSGRRG